MTDGIVRANEPVRGPDYNADNVYRVNAADPDARGSGEAFERELKKQKEEEQTEQEALEAAAKAAAEQKPKRSLDDIRDDVVLSSSAREILEQKQGTPAPDEATAKPEGKKDENPPPAPHIRLTA